MGRNKRQTEEDGAKRSWGLTAPLVAPPETVGALTESSAKTGASFGQKANRARHLGVRLA